MWRLIVAAIAFALLLAIHTRFAAALFFLVVLGLFVSIVFSSTADSRGPSV